MEREIEDYTTIAGDRMEDMAIKWTHSIQDSSSMILEGGFYFLSAAVFFFAARCLRRGRNRERKSSGPNIEVLNNTELNTLALEMKNSSNQRGGRKTRRYKKKKSHKKRKKTKKRKTHKKSKRRGRKKSHKKRR